MIQQPGQPPQHLSLEEVVGLMRQQQSHIDYLTKQASDLENIAFQYRKKMMDAMLDNITTTNQVFTDDNKFTRIEIEI